MNAFNLIPRQLKIGLALLALPFAFSNLKAHAQSISGNIATGDTITYVLYNNDLNFDTKRTLVFSDKRTVDSLASVLAKGANKQCRIVYRKEGAQAKVISPKYLSMLDRSGFYRIAIAYNKPGLPDDDKPLYIISSK